jgi:IS30 family transposase
MTYRQLSPEERYMLAALRRQGLNQSEIARSMGRHRSTVCRELRRNSTRADGRYRAFTAQERTNGRRSRSRRNRRVSAEDFALVDGLLRQYLPKGASMAALSQHQCNAIARKLNTRPRKRLGFRTPLECFNES